MSASAAASALPCATVAQRWRMACAAPCASASWRRSTVVFTVVMFAPSGLLERRACAGCLLAAAERLGGVFLGLGRLPFPHPVTLGLPALLGLGLVSAL